MDALVVNCHIIPNSQVEFYACSVSRIGRTMGALSYQPPAYQWQKLVAK
jgi:hypothetical protein